MAWYWITILCIVSGWGGYILKDQLTVEHQVNVTIHKPKIKGGGVMDLDQLVDVEHDKLTWRQRRAVRKAAKKKS